ncbi:MAG: subclass B3 metallo-beta-lactamase [Pyrinomonadaceae bacterium]|nr:subclass B3 metallo-beta-lactamase [Pyrinomonadaceae bacterium]
MTRHSINLILLTALCMLLLAFPVLSQTENFSRLPITREAWKKPFPAYRVVGNLYYVGGYDLASFMITTDKGHILVNTGVYDSVDGIKKSVESLGFSFSDVKVLLSMQAHWDHVAGFAEIKRMTGAKLFAHRADAPVLESGGVHQFFNSDPLKFSKRFGGAVFEPVKVDRRLKHGSTIRLGNTKIKLHHHGGHTKGASTFTFTTRDKGKKYKVAIVNMGSVNTSRGVKLTGMRLFPNIAKTYRRTFKRQNRLKFDIWVSSHASHFNMHDKVKPSDKYDPKRFVDPQGYRVKIELYEKRFLDTWQKEKTNLISRDD